MHCPSCGEEVREGATFCQHCGEPIDGDETATPSEPSGEDSQAPAGDRPVDRSRETTTGVGGLDSNVAGALSYLVGFITGLIFLLLEEDDEFVRFHAAQSIVVFGGLFVLSIAVQFIDLMFTGLLFSGSFFLWSFLSLIFGLIWLAVSLAALVLWIYLMVKAYQGETPRIPVAAGLADDLV